MDYKLERLATEAEEAMFSLLKGTFYEGSKDLGGVKIFYDDTIKDYYWNFATLVTVPLKDLEDRLEKVLSFFTQKGLVPAFYISPASTTPRVKEFLIQKEFVEEAGEPWMFYEEPEPLKLELNPDVTVKVAESKNDFETFIELFMVAYKEWSLGDDYRKSLADSFTDEEVLRKSAHYIAYYVGQPAGVGSIYFDDAHVSFNNDGVLPDFRRKGVWTAMTARRMSDALSRKPKMIFTQPLDERIKAALTKIGFEEKFSGSFYVLKGREW